MNQSTATAAQKPLPSPMPDLTATLRCSGKAASTSSCLLHSSTLRTSRAKSSGVYGPPAISPALRSAIPRYSRIWWPERTATVREGPEGGPVSSEADG
jgi:hypothetical protein